MSPPPARFWSRPPTVLEGHLWVPEAKDTLPTPLFPPPRGGEVGSFGFAFPLFSGLGASLSGHNHPFYPDFFGIDGLRSH